MLFSGSTDSSLNLVNSGSIIILAVQWQVTPPLHHPTLRQHCHILTFGASPISSSLNAVHSSSVMCSGFRLA